MNNSQIIEALREAMDSCQDRVLNWDCSVKDYIPKSAVLTILTRRFHSLITQLEQAGEVDIEGIQQLCQQYYLQNGKINAADTARRIKSVWLNKDSPQEMANTQPLACRDTGNIP